MSANSRRNTRVKVLNLLPHAWIPVQITSHPQYTRNNGTRTVKTTHPIQASVFWRSQKRHESQGVEMLNTCKARNNRRCFSKCSFLYKRSKVITAAQVNACCYPVKFNISVQTFWLPRTSQVLYNETPWLWRGFKIVEKSNRTNSVVLLRERPPLVGEVSTNFFAERDFAWSAWRIPTAVTSVFWTSS
jgi:hypothetical protein